MRRWVIYIFALFLSAGMVVSCSTPVDNPEFSDHPDGWLQTGSDNFHGLFVLGSAGKTDNCSSCHGADLAGDQTKASTSCFQCHSSYPHPEGFAVDASNEFHAKAIAEDFFWDLSLCQDCHGTDYAGENFESEKSCLTCHQEEDGPEACMTCHGSSASDAPPEDLSGATDTSSPGVGAHQIHLGSSGITDVFSLECSHCHADIDDFDDDGHIDGGPAMADIVFSSFATSDGSLSTTYDFATGTCSNVYCHGGFEFLKSESSTQFIYTADAIVGENPVISWTDVGTGAAACGTCHGLPPAGHLVNPSCSNCHASVVDSNNNIIDSSKHINGEIDVF